MTSIITDFKSIARKLNRQEQKAEFEANNPPAPEPVYGWPYGVAVPLAQVWEDANGSGLWRIAITPWRTAVITHPDHAPMYVKI